MSVVAPRALVVSRRSEYERLLERHGTHQQTRFFLEAHGRNIEPVLVRHERQSEALAVASAAIPARWRRSRLDRSDLSRFVFGAEDIVIAVGQDGLVANVAKYLTGQKVIGINPDPERNDGVLVQHTPLALESLLKAERHSIEERTMACATLDNGQSLFALNEIFVGHRAHQSARYRLCFDGKEEAHSSSGLIVATGTGATGWAASIFRQRQGAPLLPKPTEAVLVFFVREPFASRSTGVSIEHGRLGPEQSLEIVSEFEDSGTVFADGLEDDRLEMPWGTKLRVALAPHRLQLVRGA
jgi:NAD kinase